MLRDVLEGMLAFHLFVDILVMIFHNVLHTFFVNGDKSFIVRGLNTVSGSAVLLLSYAESCSFLCFAGHVTLPDGDSFALAPFSVLVDLFHVKVNAHIGLIDLDTIGIRLKHHLFLILFPLDLPHLLRHV